MDDMKYLHNQLPCEGSKPKYDADDLVLVPREEYATLVAEQAELEVLRHMWQRGESYYINNVMRACWGPEPRSEARYEPE